MKLIYNNVSVAIEDVQDRFKEDEEISVKLKYNSETKTFEVTVPERRVDTMPKEKPDTVYKDRVLNVTGTITVARHLKVGVDLSEERVREAGMTSIRESLEKALTKTYESINLPHPLPRRGERVLGDGC